MRHPIYNIPTSNGRIAYYPENHKAIGGNPDDNLPDNACPIARLAWLLVREATELSPFDN
jgi:hypothetical protein